MVRRSSIVAALLCLLLIATVDAGSAEVRTWTLDKSTTLVLVEDHRAPVVEVMVDLPVGTWSPWARKHHLEEAFEMLLQDGRGRLRARADALGLDLRIEARPHSSRLTLSVLAEDLPEAAKLVRAILTNTDIDRHVLSRWHKSRLLRWEGSVKNPFFVLSQTGARLLFTADDPRRWRWEVPQPVLQDVDRLLAARDVLLKAPGRVIAMAGDVDRKTVEKLGGGLLPPVVGEAPGELTPVFGPLASVGGAQPGRRVELARLTQVYFAYGRSSLTFDDPLWPSFLVADHVLGGHFLSRLSVALRHSGGETYGVRTVNHGGEVVGFYSIVTATRADNAAAMEKKILQVLKCFHEHGISEEERQAAVGFLQGRLLLDSQSPRDTMERTVWEIRHGYPRGLREQLVGQASTATLEQINSFITSFYDPSGFTMIRVVPD